MNDRMVRVRIAVAVDSDGKWSAGGWSEGSDRNIQEDAQEGLDSPNPQLVHFVECLILIPRGHLLNGTCVLTKEVQS